jgi:hypothetical protein
MDVNQQSLEAVAAKLAPLTAELSDGERDLLNEVFNRALQSVEAEVAGFGLIGGSVPMPTTTRPPGGGGSQTPPGGGGGGTLPPGGGGGTTTPPSAPFDPVRIRFFV